MEKVGVLLVFERGLGGNAVCSGVGSAVGEMVRLHLPYDPLPRLLADITHSLD